MGELLKQKEIVNVAYEDNNQRVDFTGLHEEMGEIRMVTWNKNVFDKNTKKFVPNADKAAQVEEWCQEYFGCTFDELGQVALGKRMDIYCYDTFNSFWECHPVQKFDDDMEGQILTGVIVKAEDTGNKISLIFEYDGKHYESKMQYADFLDAQQKWFVNPQKKAKQYKKFEEKFGFPISEIESMVGREVTVEVKKAYGQHIYNEIKPFPKKKGKVS